MPKRIVCLLLAVLAAATMYVPAQAREPDSGETDGSCTVSADTKESLAAPRLKSVSLAADGVKVTWGAVKGADRYRVFYRTGSGSWKRAGDTAGTGYTVTGLKSGRTYTFTVRCLSADGESYAGSYDRTGLSVRYVAAPTVKIAAAAGGVKVTWNSVAGAARYAVYYREGNGPWHRIGTTPDTGYTWKKAVVGKTYRFTVRCTDADKVNISAYKASNSLKYLSAPKLKSVSLAADGVKVTWAAVKGADRYRVYYRTGSGAWKKAGDTAKTSYTVTGLTGGKEYAFTVRCMDADGTAFASAYDKTGKSVLYIAAPTVRTAANAAGGVKVTWDAVKGTARYRVFYKTGSDGWKRAGDTAGTSYTVTGLASGKEYVFTVRCLSANGKSYASAYDKTGKSIRYIAAPTVRLVNINNGMMASWNKVAGASGYKVYFRAKGSGGWNLLGSVKSTSYSWNDAVLGMSYAFTVRAVGEDAVSSYESSGYVRYTGAASSASPTDT